MDAWVYPGVVCAGYVSGTGTVFSPNTSVLVSHYHSTHVLYVLTFHSSTTDITTVVLAVDSLIECDTPSAYRLGLVVLQ